MSSQRPSQGYSYKYNPHPTLTLTARTPLTANLEQPQNGMYVGECAKNSCYCHDGDNRHHYTAEHVAYAVARLLSGHKTEEVV